MLEQLLIALKVIAVVVVVFAATMLFLIMLEVLAEGGDGDD